MTENRHDFYHDFIIPTIKFLVIDLSNIRLQHFEGNLIKAEE